MIVDEETIRQIRSARTRRRLVVLPVRHGAFGERLRCPMQEGGVYRLVPCSPLEHKRRQAKDETQSHRLAVLRFIELVEGLRPTSKQLSLRVTVTHPPHVVASGHPHEMWVVPITSGDLSGQNDRPLFLAASGDYTFSASRQAVPGDPEVMFPNEGDLHRARQRARERQSAPASAAVRAMRESVDTLKGAMLTMKAENRRKLIAKELEKLHGELDADAA